MGEAIAPNAALTRHLGIWSAAALVVGTVIGTGIFLVPTIMARELPSAAAILATWVVGGVLSFFGALAYAELGTIFPATGGQYVFLRESFGPMLAFLCGWTLFLVVMSGEIAFLATGFATYLGSFVKLNAVEARATAVGVIAAFTVINRRGLNLGSVVQNILTALKLAGIAVLVFAAFFSHQPSHLHLTAKITDFHPQQFGLALAVALMAYDGWNTLSFVNGEIRNPLRTIPIALCLGVALCATVYVIVTAAYLRVLPVSAIASSTRVGSDAATLVLGSKGSIFVTITILISILGSTNGTVLTSPRLYFAQAQDGLFFARFSELHPRFQTPSFAIVMQGLWASLLAWSGSYELLATYAIFCAWFFYLLIVVGLIVLRKKRPYLSRPYSMWGYPFTPLLFAAVTLWFLVDNLLLNPIPSVSGLIVVASGVPAYMVWKYARR